MKPNMHLLPSPVETLLFKEGDGPLEFGKASWHSLDLKWFHLYETSDEEMKDNDWCHLELGENSRIVQVHSLKGTHPVFNVDIGEGYAQLSSLRKIIATTDPKLHLKSMHYDSIQAFIDAYNAVPSTEEFLYLAEQGVK